MHDEVLAYRLYILRLVSARDEFERDIIASENVPIPDALALFEAMHYPEHYPWAGGYMDQPFILMQELRIVELALEEAEAIQLENLANRAEHEAIVGAKDPDSHVGDPAPPLTQMSGDPTTFFGQSSLVQDE